MNFWIDTHAHIYAEEFRADAECHAFAVRGEWRS